MSLKSHTILSYSLFAALTIFCLTFVGCGPSTTNKPSEKPSRYETIEQNTLMHFLRESEIGISPGILTKDYEVGGYPVGDYLTAANYVMPDENYMLVDEEWFKMEFLNSLDFKTFLFNNGIENPAYLRNDCDDFSRAFSFYVRIKFRTMGFKNATPAVGDLYYADPYMDTGAELGGGHAINMGVFLDKNGNKVIRFIEPQGPHFVDLPKEYQKYYIDFMGM